MKDRLEELRMRAREAGDPCDPDDTFAFDNPVFSQEEAGPMSKVFQEGSNLSLALDKLQELSENIDEKQQRVLCCTTEESICEEKRGLGAMKASFTSEAKLIQPQLSAMHERLVRDGRPCGAGYRIRQNQLSLLVRRYRDILTRHYSKETLYVGKLKEQIARQAELAGFSLPEKDVEELAERPVAPRIVGRDLEVLRAKQQLAVAQVRHQQLLDLEAQIMDLHSLFLQLEVLVSEQHEVINNVEHYVMHTLDYVSQSSEEVKKALQYKRPSRLAALLAAALSLCACCTCLSCLAGSVR